MEKSRVVRLGRGLGCAGLLVVLALAAVSCGGGGSDSGSKGNGNTITGNWGA